MKIIKVISFILIVLTKVAFSQTTNNFYIYPNPFSDTLDIKLNLLDTAKVSLNIYSILGQKMDSAFNGLSLIPGSYTLKLTENALPDGVYLFILATDSNRLVKKAEKLTSATGVENANTIKIVLSPNPTKDLLVIPIEAYKKIIIEDITSRIIKTISTSSQSISILNLNAGIYFISIYSADKKLIVRQKICKVN